MREKLAPTPTTSPSGNTTLLDILLFLPNKERHEVLSVMKQQLTSGTTPIFLGDEVTTALQCNGQSI